MFHGINNKLQQCKTVTVLTVILLLYCTSPALGIIFHPNEGEPNLSTWTNRPADELMGKWGSNASCVAISPNHILTTKHQGGTIGTNIQIDQINYKVIQETDIASDLRVARIITTDGQPANLSSYAPLYTSTNLNGKTFVIGGFGKIRGEPPLKTPGGTTYGYTWAENTSQNLHWGSNKVDAYSTILIQGTFDGINEGDHITYEASPAEHDSGGGWFIKGGATWKLAGITVAVDPCTPFGQTWFREPDDPANPDPDTFLSFRVRPYQQDITDEIEDAKIISGYVLTESGNPCNAVMIEADSGTRTTSTDTNGYYDLWVPNGWSGTVVPIKPGLLFSPASTSYTSVTNDLTNRDYTGTFITYSISGHILDPNDQPLADIIVDANSGGDTVLTDANGLYELWAGYNWSGTVIPSKQGYYFDPNVDVYENVLNHQTDMDFMGIRNEDINMDGFINWDDIAVLSNQWLDTQPGLEADINGDGTVNLKDLSRITPAW